MIATDQLRENLERVRASIGAACERVGRNPSDIRMLPITKTHSVALIETLLAMGLTDFGENRVPELRAKAAHFRDAGDGRPRWHFVGSLQRNKAKHIVAAGVRVFHAIDSVALAEELARQCERQDSHIEGFIEVNVSGEQSKHGFTPDQAESALREILALDRVQVGGLMTMAPWELEPEATRPVFRELRLLRDRLEHSLSCALPALSMGMTNDYEIAVEEGATIVRIGTALFGPRERRETP